MHSTILQRQEAGKPASLLTNGATLRKERVGTPYASHRFAKPKTKKVSRFSITILVVVYHLAGIAFYGTGAAEHIQHLIHLGKSKPGNEMHRALKSEQ